MKVGIDPDSDVAENLRSGLITVDDILRTRQPQQPTAQSTQEPEAQPPTLDQKLQSLQKRLGRSDPVTNEEYKQDMSAALDVIGTLVRDIQDGKREQNTQRLFEEVTTSTKEVFSSQLKDKIPEDVRDMGEKLFFYATDQAAGELAASIGRDAAFTGDRYRQVAGKLIPQFDKFISSIFKAGAQAQMSAMNKGGGGIAPIAPGHSGGAPPPPNKVDATLESLDDRAAQFMQGTQLRV
jgi:hypothetical protein